MSPFFRRYRAENDWSNNDYECNSSKLSACGAQSSKSSLGPVDTIRRDHRLDVAEYGLI